MMTGEEIQKNVEILKDGVLGVLEKDRDAPRMTAQEKAMIVAGFRLFEDFLVNINALGYFAIYGRNI